MRSVGVGTLFFRDGREWGGVRYVVDHQERTAMQLGRITGRFEPLEPGPAHQPPFLAFYLDREAVGALRMEDGRWWICSVHADGEAINTSGFHPAGPQPKRQ
jgi:hypothetical protein